MVTRKTECDLCFENKQCKRLEDENILWVCKKCSKLTSKKLIIYEFDLLSQEKQREIQDFISNYTSDWLIK